MKYRAPEIVISRDAVFANDRLNREDVVEFLVNHVEQVDAPYVIAIDAPFGNGKSTLVRMLEASLDKETVSAIYVNLWEHDFTGDPLVPIIVALQEGGTSESSRKHWESAKRWGGAIVKHGAVAAVRAATLGVLDLDKDIEKVASDATGALTSDVVTAFQEERKSIAVFKQEVEKAIQAGTKEGRKGKLVVILDELDRCRPSFAIETLERIKHLFNVEGLIFVLSVDKSQLEASVAAIYGERIDAGEYLRKFFDMEFGIPAAADDRFTGSLLSRFELDNIFSSRKGATTSSDRDNFVKFFTKLADAYSLSLRARERCVARLCIVLSQTTIREYLDPVLVALLIVIRARDKVLFDRITNGFMGSEQVIETLESLPHFSADQHSPILGAIEGYLLAGDRNESRRNQRLTALKSGTATASDGRGRQYEHSLRLYENLINGERGDIDLRAVARKVDIAAHVRN